MAHIQRSLLVVWLLLLLLQLCVNTVQCFVVQTTTTTATPSSIVSIATTTTTTIQKKRFQQQQRHFPTTITTIPKTTTPSSTNSQLYAFSSIVGPIKLASAATTLITLVSTAIVKLYLDKPSRTYGNDTVAREYDAWADDGILEYYWGEHIHLGYYTPSEIAEGYIKKNFIQAKYDFIDEMMKFANIDPKQYTTTTPSTGGVKVLDVGCGFGGTSRYLAKKLGTNSHVTGITLSPKQVARGTELAIEQNVANNTQFLVMNALDMQFPNNTFDIVWACESGEHMPDKAQYINEMIRVLKPGGTFVMACWSQRDNTTVPFDTRDIRDLNYLYEEWTHPYFISIPAWKQLMENTGTVQPVTTANWVKETIASWRHSILVGIIDPMGWIFKPKTYIKCVRDAYCLERMHRAFKRGLMEYGMFTTTKKL